MEIRIRAERRAGQLLAEIGRTPGARTDRTSGQAEPRLTTYAEVKREAHVSDHQAKRWQQLAEIPHKDFEGKLHDSLVEDSTRHLRPRGSRDFFVD